MTCATLRGGSVKCWGITGPGQGQPNFIQQWGLGDEPGELTPTLPPIDLGPGVTTLAIANGGWFNCALLTGQTIKCWGTNAHGELGLGDTLSRGGLATELGANLPLVSLD